MQKFDYLFELISKSRLTSNVFFKFMKNFKIKLGDNCIKNSHLGRYIVVNLVLRRCVSGAVKRDFRTYIRRYTSPNKKFEYGYPHFNSLLTFFLQKTVKMYYIAPTSSSCQLHKTACKLHIFTCQPIKRRYVMSSSISQDILLQIYDVIQSDVAFHLQVH